MTGDALRSGSAVHLVAGHVPLIGGDTTMDNVNAMAASGVDDDQYLGLVLGPVADCTQLSVWEG